MPSTGTLSPEMAADLIEMRRRWKSGTLDLSLRRPERNVVRQNPQRWLPVKNTESALDIPAFGCVEVESLQTEGDDFLNYHIPVRRPKSDAGGAEPGTGIYMFVGNEPIEANGFGVATLDLPTWALYEEDETPSDVIGMTVTPDFGTFDVSENHYGPTATELFQGHIFKSLGSQIDGNGRTRVLITDAPSHPFITGDFVSPSAMTLNGNQDLSISYESRAFGASDSSASDDTTFWVYDTGTYTFTCQRSGFFHVWGAATIQISNINATAPVGGGNVGTTGAADVYAYLTIVNAYGGSSTGASPVQQADGLNQYSTHYFDGFVGARPAGTWGAATTLRITMNVANYTGSPSPNISTTGGRFSIERLEI